MKIPFNIPYIAGYEERYILEALRSRKHCGNYGFAQKCTDHLKEQYGFKEIYLTPSCTAAMEMGALLADLKEGDEVIMPSYTFSSTANAIALRGAKPVFCDIDPNTMNIDVRLIEKLVTDKTRMILPIDYAGIPCEMDEILELAKKHQLLVMQDAAQSLASWHKSGKACGAMPDFAAFSFHETKNITCGEGGALIVNNEDFIERASYLQEKGTDRSLVLKGVKNKYGWVDLGSSFLLSDILAAMLYGQLEATSTVVDKRKKIFTAYGEIFADYESKGCLRIPHPPSDVKLNYHAYFVIFDSESNQKLFLEKARTKNVFPYIGYVPLHSSEYGKKLGYKTEDCPITEDVGKRIVRLPFYTDLADDGLEYCIDSLNEVLAEIYAN